MLLRKGPTQTKPLPTPGSENAVIMPFLPKSALKQFTVEKSREIVAGIINIIIMIVLISDDPTFVCPLYVTEFADHSSEWSEALPRPAIFNHALVHVFRCGMRMKWPLPKFIVFKRVHLRGEAIPGCQHRILRFIELNKRNIFTTTPVHLRWQNYFPKVVLLWGIYPLKRGIPNVIITLRINWVSPN
jgi:hypothetical protein